MRVALRLSIACLALIVGLLALPSRAAADGVVISLQENGGAIQNVTSGSGYALYVGQFGDYLFNGVSGTGTPNLAEPGLQSSTIDISGGGKNDLLNIFVTETGLTSISGVNPFLSSFSAAFSANVSSVLEQTFIGDPGSGTLLSSYLFTGSGSSSSLNNTPYLTGSFDETVEYTIKTTGVGIVDASIQIAGAPVSTPEPSTLLLMGLGLGSLLLLGKRRRFSLAQRA